MAAPFGGFSESGDFAFQLDQAVERSRKVFSMIEAKTMTNVLSDNVSSDTANVPSETKKPSNGVKPIEDFAVSGDWVV
jgi:hypothetical protein